MREVTRGRQIQGSIAGTGTSNSSEAIDTRRYRLSLNAGAVCAGDALTTAGAPTRFSAIIIAARVLELPKRTGAFRIMPFQSSPTGRAQRVRCFLLPPNYGALPIQIGTPTTDSGQCRVAASFTSFLETGLRCDEPRQASEVIGSCN